MNPRNPENSTRDTLGIASADDNYGYYTVSITIDDQTVKVDAPIYKKTGEGVRYHTVTYTVPGTTVESFEVLKGTTLAVPAPAQADGYYFDGWYTEADFKTAYSEEAAVNADVNLYAKMLKITNQAATVFVDADITAAVYEAVGLAFASNKISVNTDKLVPFVNNPTKATIIERLSARIEGQIAMGLTMTMPAGAIKVAIAENLAFETAADTIGENPVVSDIPVAAESGASIENTTHVTYYKWLDKDNKIIAITKATIAVETTKQVAAVQTVISDFETESDTLKSTMFKVGENNYDIYIAGTIATGLANEDLIALFNNTQQLVKVDKYYAVAMADLIPVGKSTIVQTNPMLEYYKGDKNISDVGGVLTKSKEYNKEDAADYVFLLGSYENGQTITVAVTVEDTLTTYTIHNLATITASEAN